VERSGAVAAVVVDTCGAKVLVSRVFRGGQRIARGVVSPSGGAMDITDVRVFPVAEDKLKAYVAIVFDDCFVVGDIKVIQGAHGLFISMPSKKRRNGTFRDIAHPLNSETRRRIEDAIIARYRQVMEDSGAEDSTPIRSLDEDTEHDDPAGASRAEEEDDERYRP